PVRRPGSGRRDALRARRPRRSGNRTGRAWADASPAASIAYRGLRASVAREMAAEKARKLVIVESPAKAKTIAGYLGKEFVVESSIGHIRDLPQNAAEIPAKYKDESWARLGVNVDKDFEPLYVVDSRKKKVVS